MFQNQKDKELICKKRNRVLIVSLVFFAFLFGWAFGHLDFAREKIGYSPGTTSENGTTANFKTFWDAWDKIVQNYDGQIDYQKLIYGAIDGMVKALDDPYTVFLDKESSGRFDEDLEGTISGIGAEIGVSEDKRIIVISPISNSPADKAGLKAKDLILEIDDQDTYGLALDDAVSKIRGKAGTAVKLDIERDGKSLSFTIIREKIEIKSVKGKIIENNIGYLEISKFDSNTGALLKEEGNKFTNGKVQGIVIDLRNNPGGYLDQAIAVVGEFIDEGVAVVEKKEKDGKTKEYKVTGKGQFTDKNLPVVILINEGSASAAEIVAGALDDYDRATLVGIKTFGKGSVQTIESIGSGSTLHITTAHWYTPKGRTIDGVGLSPDIEIQLTDSNIAQNIDTQLNKAIEIIRSKIRT